MNIILFKQGLISFSYTVQKCVKFPLYKNQQIFSSKLFYKKHINKILYHYTWSTHKSSFFYCTPKSMNQINDFQTMMMYKFIRLFYIELYKIDFY